MRARKMCCVQLDQSPNNIFRMYDFCYIVKPPVSGHPRDQKKRPLKRGAHLWEVKNVAFVGS